MEAIEFTVLGQPQPRGSKQAVLIPKRGGGFIEKNGRPIVATKDDNPRSRDWMNSVRCAARSAYQGDLIRGPVSVHVAFFLPRPKCHFGTGRNATSLKGSAPEHHAQKPDCDKLLRGTLDALKGVVWVDDSQVREISASKNWTQTTARADIRIEPTGELFVEAW
jgi:Holliday junction resolvase RusA-like endonuclease